MGGSLLPSYEKFHQRKFAKKICLNGVSKTTSLGRKNNHTETYKMAFFPGKKLGGCRNTTYPPKPIQGSHSNKGDWYVCFSPILPSSIVPCCKSTWPNLKVHIAIWLFCLVDFTCSFCQLHFAKLQSSHCLIGKSTLTCLTLQSHQLQHYCYLPNLFCQIAKYISPCELP
jgi:hypothetical protein